MSDKELQGLKKLNDRQDGKGEKSGVMIVNDVPSPKDRRIGVTVVFVLFAAICVFTLGCSETEYPPLEIDSGSVLADMQASFESAVSRVEISGHPGRVKIDVYTDFYPDRDVADVSRGMALIAVQSSTIRDAYPSAAIDAYVWPKSEAFYMARASASYTNGVLDGPFDSYVNSVLK